MSDSPSISGAESPSISVETPTDAANDIPSLNPTSNGNVEAHIESEQRQVPENPTPEWFLDWRKHISAKPVPIENITEERFLQMLLDQAQVDGTVPPARSIDDVETSARVDQSDHSDESMDDSEDEKDENDQMVSDNEHPNHSPASPQNHTPHSPQSPSSPRSKSNQSTPAMSPNDETDQLTNEDEQIDSPSNSPAYDSPYDSPASPQSPRSPSSPQSKSNRSTPDVSPKSQSVKSRPSDLSSKHQQKPSKSLHDDDHSPNQNPTSSDDHQHILVQDGRSFHIGPTLPELNALPPAPLIKSMFDELYAIPDKSQVHSEELTEQYTMISESETESESEEIIIRRAARIRRLTINHHSCAVVNDDSIFGWNWPLSVVAGQSSLNLSHVSVPANLEAGVVLGDGFDLPAPALPYSTILPTTLEEQEEEAARLRHANDVETLASLPLEFQYRIKDLSTQIQNSSPPSVNPDAYSPAAVMSLLDPPVPNQHWRTAWQQVCSHLPNITLTHVWPKLPAATQNLDTLSSSPRSASPVPADPPVVPNYSVCRLPAPPTRVHAQIIANMSVREMRFRAAHSFRLMKERTSVLSRVNRDVAVYWKKHDKEVIEMRRKLDREEAEKRKKIQEAREAERQKKKLDFLLTQTELYSHFIGSKMGLIDPNARSKQDASEIAADLKSFENNERRAAMTEEAAEAAKKLMVDRQKQISKFDADLASSQGTAHAQQLAASSPPDNSQKDPSIDLLNPSTMPQQAEFYACPESFNGDLKSYQLKGLNWLINLYDQGINGILADEMGLGKTIQSIVFLAFLASQRQLYGPFLVVCPNSTLHQWQQEVTKFCPSLKVMPYWGTQQERAVIRKFWQPSQLSQPDSPFHVLVTSYHIMVSDAKYFQRIKWQYLICDEAQSLKNSASQRWKSLLSLKCRNRVLLTGTPIQNSMAELWALLHFIMPEFFDSHAEFNEWFSKDIEEQAENALQSQKNRQLARLHLILKPFMLRRVKKDVENEMPPKVELLVDCPLSTRQRFYYRQLQQRVRKIGTEKIMNIAMQFRKVCNHPTLFMSRSAISSLNFTREHSFAAHRISGLSQTIQVYSTAARFDGNPIQFTLPACVMDAGLDLSKNRILYHTLNFNNAQWINRSLHEDKQSAFAWSRFCGMSPAELAFMMHADPCFLMLAHASLNHTINQTRAHQSYNSLAYNSFHQFTTPSSPISELMADFDRTFLQPTMLLIAALAPSLPNPLLALSPPSVIRVMTETSSMRNSITLVSQSGDDRSAAAADLAVQEAMTLADKRYELVHFGLDPTRLHCDNDPNQLFSHRRGLLQTLHSAYLPRVTAPPIYPYLPGNSNSWLRVRMGWPEYTGWERSVFTGVDHIASSNSSPLPLSPYVRPPASFSIACAVAPAGLLGRWTDITNPACTRPLPYQRTHELINQIVLPYHVVDAPLSDMHQVAPFQSLLVPTASSLVHDSGKLARLDALLEKLHANGHRVLIFSQMTRMLDLIGELLHHRRYSHLRLDGQTSLASRRDMVRAYQTDPSIFCFILSTRAGGLGINLTAADTVIFYDNDWNPTNDAQAMDRSHRIGQTKSVTVYRLVCRHTVEERILNRAQVKHNIQNSVYSGGFKMTEEQEAAQAQALIEDVPDETVQGGDEDALDTQHFFGERELRDLMLSEEPASSSGADTIQPLSNPSFSAFDDMQMDAQVDLNDDFEVPTASLKPASRSSPVPQSGVPTPAGTASISGKPKTKKELQKEAAALRVAERKAATLAKQNAREEEKRKRAADRAEQARLKAEQKSKQNQEKKSESTKSSKSVSSKPRQKRQRSESSKTDKEGKSSRSRKKVKTVSSSGSSSDSGNGSGSSSSGDSSSDTDSGDKRPEEPKEKKKRQRSTKKKEKKLDSRTSPDLHSPVESHGQSGMLLDIVRSESFV